MENMLKIAIPNKGRLSEKIYDLLNKAGLNLDYKDERKLSTTTKDGRYSIIFVRTQDIPKFLDANVADVGITGFDIVEEEGLDFDIVKDFGFGACDLVVAVGTGTINDMTRLMRSMLQQVSQTQQKNISKALEKMFT